jgi:hypothetical protein
MPFDYVAVRVVNSFVPVAQVSAHRAQGCQDRQNNEQKLLHERPIQQLTEIRNAQ